MYLENPVLYILPRLIHINFGPFAIFHVYSPTTFFPALFAFFHFYLYSMFFKIISIYRTKLEHSLKREESSLYL